MHVTYLDHVALTGPFTELHVDWRGEPGGTGAPLTFNQRNHLAAAAASGRSTWIGGTLPVPSGAASGAVASGVAEAVQTVIAGADALRSVARGDRQHAYAPDAVSVTVGPTAQDVPTPGALEARMAGRCRPGAVPGLFFALCGGELVVGVDHFHADMLSVWLLLRRIHGELTGRPLDPGASFLDTSPAETPDPDAALDVWRGFLDTTGGRVPAFPVDLGVTGPVEPVHDVRHLLDAAELTGQLDARTFAVVLTALAGALEPVTGASEFATVIPVHTRGRRADPRHNVVGWMVGNAPVIASAGDVDATLGWLRDAVAVAGLPLETMMEQLAPTLPDGVVPMVSYMDFRGGAGDGPLLPEGTRYVSSSSPTDTVQLWFSRSDAGLDLRAKYPDTPAARALMDRVLTDLGYMLRKHSR
ncbi:hypothetical protein ACT3SZ_03350 [Corynebacterium sp. AOP40-9SA-29]|uniref:hypothetical protein n=1 Tax=Corynebacterium sp. AOP40-9SA-29 TaxID=3457677 RepID=UPI0040332518